MILLESAWEKRTVEKAISIAINILNHERKQWVRPKQKMDPPKQQNKYPWTNAPKLGFITYHTFSILSSFSLVAASTRITVRSFPSHSLNLRSLSVSIVSHSSFLYAAMADVIEEPVAVVSDPNLIEVKLFNRWSFDDVQVYFFTFLQFHHRFRF